MTTVFYHRPRLNNPVFIACWPGIGNIGLIAVDALREQLQAQEFAEIQPWEFFYPRKVTIESGVLKTLEFPASKFYYRKMRGQDIIIFVGDEQPAEGGRTYAEGQKAYDIASLVLDVAEKYRCRRIYTSGAAISLSHHSSKPRVWAVSNTPALNDEIKKYRNTVLMGEVEGRNGHGSITGLNGLLLGMAKARGFEAVCLMGEIPDYLSTVPFPYPKSSRAVLRAFSEMLKIDLDYTVFDSMIGNIENVIENIYDKFPRELKDTIDIRKTAIETIPETITEEESKWIKEHIDELFKKKDKDSGHPS